MRCRRVEAFLRERRVAEKDRERRLTSEMQGNVTVITALWAAACGRGPCTASAAPAPHHSGTYTVAQLGTVPLFSRTLHPLISLLGLLDDCHTKERERKTLRGKEGRGERGREIGGRVVKYKRRGTRANETKG